MRKCMGTMLVVLLGVACGYVQADPIKDVSDGRYFSWTVDQGLGSWTLRADNTTPGYNTSSTISDGGLEMIDNSTGDWVNADGYFPNTLTSTSYVIQYDIKWKDFTPSAGLNYFAIQDRNNGSGFTNRMYLAIDKYPSTFGIGTPKTPASVMTDRSQVVLSTSPYPVVFVNTWCRVIVERSGDNYYTTVQQLQDCAGYSAGYIWINRVSKAMWNPTVQPTKIEFTSGAANANHRVDVVINNVKVGEVYSPADVNRDGKVNAADLDLLADHWGQGPGADPTYDLDVSGFVDGGDLTILTNNWGSGY